MTGFTKCHVTIVDTLRSSPFASSLLYSYCISCFSHLSPEQWNQLKTRPTIRISAYVGIGPNLVHSSTSYLHVRLILVTRICRLRIYTDWTACNLIHIYNPWVSWTNPFSARSTIIVGCFMTRLSYPHVWEMAVRYCLVKHVQLRGFRLT